MEKDPHLQALMRIIELQEKILLKLEQHVQGPILDPNAASIFDDLVDSVDVKSKLKISDSTLYRIKKSNLIHTKQIGKRDYYSLTEITKIIPHFLK